MKKQNLSMLVVFIIALHIIATIVGLIAQSVVLGIQIIIVLILLTFGIKAILAVKALLETFFNQKN